MRKFQVLRPPPVKVALQQQCGCYFVHLLFPAAARNVSFQKRLLCNSSGKPLVPKLNFCLWKAFFNCICNLAHPSRFRPFAAVSAPRQSYQQFGVVILSHYLGKLLQPIFLCTQNSDPLGEKPKRIADRYTYSNSAYIKCDYSLQ